MKSLSWHVYKHYAKLWTPIAPPEAYKKCGPFLWTLIVVYLLDSQYRLAILLSR